MAKTKKKTVVVLGMHRSGTSAVAGTLQILGVDMGTKLKKADQANPKGYFEDELFLKINKAILRDKKLSWDKPPKSPIKTTSSKNINQLKKYIKSKKDLWGWKDPRTCLLLGIYAKLVKNIHLITVFRNPLEIAKSLEERDGIKIQDGIELTNKYNSLILRQLNLYPKYPKLYISFEEIIACPVSIAKKIATFLELKITKKNIAAIESLILPTSIIYQERQRMIYEDLLNTRGWKVINTIHKIRTKIPLLRKL
jgi:hypothetical protein